MDVIEEYRKTLQGLFALLERKRAMLREKQMDVGEYNRIKHHIHVIQKEIYEVQDVIRALEGGKKGGPIHYGYRRRVYGDMYGCFDYMEDLPEKAAKKREPENEENYPADRAGGAYGEDF